MLMLYALNIIKAINDLPIERMTVETKNIIEFCKCRNADFPFVLYANVNGSDYRIELKPNKNFSTVTEFFEYIRPYKEIDFETKEIPTKKKEPKIGDIYRKNEKYLLILGLDIYYVCGICKRGIITEFLTPSKDDVIKYWKYVGNKENAAYNINIAFKSFNDFVDEKEK